MLVFIFFHFVYNHTFEKCDGYIHTTCNMECTYNCDFVFASIKFSDFNYAYSNFLFLYQCLFGFLKLIKVFDNNTKI